MEARMDFLDRLGSYLSSEILMYLDDPSDLFHVSRVSRAWRHLVIENGLWKQLCLRLFPQLSRVARVIELNNGSGEEPMEVGCSYQMEWESLERDDRVYALLVQYCTSFLAGNCVSEAISASSTDNYPEESVENTLQPADIVERRASYWSSKGQRNPAVPETLIFKLASELCVITEIHIRPFQAYFQFGLPIYSAKFVRFRMGHPRSLADVACDLPGDSLPGSADDKFVWTYSSQEFPMAQDLKRIQEAAGFDNTARLRTSFSNERIWSEPDVCTSMTYPPPQKFRMKGFRVFRIYDMLRAVDSNISMATGECQLQKFKLPEPVLCVGGILQIELLGRVQRQEMDGLFYICISHVQVVGRSLSPAFGVEILEPSGKFVLKNDLKHKFHTHPSLPKEEPGEIYADRLQRRLMDLERIVNLLQGNVVEDVDEYEFGEENNEALEADHL